MNRFMKSAIDEAYAGIYAGDGGPFGAVVVKDGTIIAKGHNRVLSSKDPTRHGEIDAIRKACDILGTHDLSGCDLYTTGEPCPMCLAAILWANIENTYYCAELKDNAAIGFRDDAFDNIVKIDRSKVKLFQIDAGACRELFKKFKELNGIIY